MNSSKYTTSQIMGHGITDSLGKTNNCLFLINLSSRHIFFFFCSCTIGQKMNVLKYWVSYIKNNGLELTVTKWPTRYLQTFVKIWPSRPNHHFCPLCCSYLGLQYSDIFLHIHICFLQILHVKPEDISCYNHYINVD